MTDTYEPNEFLERDMELPHTIIRDGEEIPVTVYADYHDGIFDEAARMQDGRWIALTEEDITDALIETFSDARREEWETDQEIKQANEDWSRDR